MNIIVTMANDPRFRRDAGATPLYATQAGGRSLFEWSLESLKNFFNERFIFVTLKGQKAQKLVRDACENLGIADYSLKEIPPPCKGQAAAAAASKSVIRDLREPCVLFAPQNYISPSELNPRLLQGDGWIPCYHCTASAPVYLDYDQSMRVTEISEKSRVSDFATPGFYYFRSFELFERCFTQCHYIGHKEQSVPPLYVILSKFTSKSIFTFIISSRAVHPLTNAAQIKEFAAWCESAPAPTEE
jgi:hypothetical protein